MSGRREQRRRDRVRGEIERVTGDLEPITDHDLKIIKHALTDRVVLHGGQGPAAQGAMNVLDKILRNETKAAGS